MPTMANITVKKADNTTDVVYVAISPAGGDLSEAQWRVEAAGAIAANRPKLYVKAKASADGKVRIVDWRHEYPETSTNTSTGVVSITYIVRAKGTFYVPLNATDTSITECAAQSANLLKSSLIQSTLTSGIAPQ